MKAPYCALQLSMHLSNRCDKQNQYKFTGGGQALCLVGVRSTHYCCTIRILHALHAVGGLALMRGEHDVLSLYLVIGKSVG